MEWKWDQRVFVDFDQTDVALVVKCQVAPCTTPEAKQTQDQPKSAFVSYFDQMTTEL